MKVRVKNEVSNSPKSTYGTLVIKHVDLWLLEHQRKILNEKAMELDRAGGQYLDKEAMRALYGILNMLDYWSDEMALDSWTADL